MTTLENIQNKVTLVGKFLFNKQVELPTTIKGCEAKLENYYKWYGYTYFDVCKATGTEIKIIL
jgi:hypothetical protein